MENYNRHNDLISNFFYLIKIIANYTSTKIYDEIIHFSNEFVEPTEKETEQFTEANEELKKILPILKDKYGISITDYEPQHSCEFFQNKPDNLILDNYEHLLISGFFYGNWKPLIKSEMKELNTSSFISIKKRIIASLVEVKYRATNFSWTIETDLHSNYVDNCHFHYFNSIDDDILWVSNLTINDIENQKIKLSSKLNKKKLISLIIEIQKGKENYNETIGLEIEKFINFITDENSVRSDYNLSFLKNKDENREFAKIFLLLQSKKLILNKTKGELNQIISDCLNISDTTLENFYTIKKLKKELENTSNPTSEVYLINEHLKLF